MPKSTFDSAFPTVMQTLARSHLPFQ